jgi:hypothetical protein
MPKIFISYTYDSEDHAKQVGSFCNQLMQDGIDCTLEQYEDVPEQGRTKADFVLMICTQNYYNKVNRKKDAGKGLDVKWEGNDTKNTSSIPVLFDQKDVDYIPLPLKNDIYYTVDSKENYEKLYARIARITNQPKIPKLNISRIRYLPREKKEDFFAYKQAAPKAKMSVKLPNTDAKVLGYERKYLI